jgi:hypothetical protein
METKSKNSFKAVDFMRQVRNELSELYHTDKERYHNELKKSMADFLTARTKAPVNMGLKPIRVCKIIFIILKVSEFSPKMFLDRELFGLNGAITQLNQSPCNTQNY